jgi:hypothetical protein
MGRWVALLVVALLGSACSSSGGSGSISLPAGGQGTLQVDRVDVHVTASAPRHVSVRVRGFLMDGCTSLEEIRQRRDGNTVTVTISTSHTGARACTQVAQLVDETIVLDGDFPPGAYVVRVNGVESRFRV